MDSKTHVATTLDLEGVTDASGETRALVAQDHAQDPLLVLALKQQVPMDVLERVVALVERREEKSARQQFIEAMARFRSECPLIQKPRDSKQKEVAGTTRTGAGFHFKYAPLDEITETIRPYAEKNNLSYTWSCRHEPGILIVTCKLQHVGGHEEKSDFPTPLAGSVATNDQHKFAAAFTFGRRQSLFGVFGLATTDDTPDKPQDMEKITEEQAANISALVEEILTAAERREAFGRYLHGIAGTGIISDLPANRYAEVVAALEKARKS